MSARGWGGLLVACSSLLTACSANLKTAHDLGLAPFEPLIGAETRLRAEPNGGGFLDAASEDGGGRQAADVQIVPTGTVDDVLVAVGALAFPDSHPVSGAAVAIYPLKHEETFPFEFRGVLPPGDPLLVTTVSKPDADGAVRLLAKLPRARIPAGTQRIAYPVVVRFENGGIHVKYLHGVLPEPGFVPDESTDQPPTKEGQQ